MLRFLLWRLLGLLSVMAAAALVAWFIDGGLGRSLRGRTAPSPDPQSVLGPLWRFAARIYVSTPALGLPLAALLAGLGTLVALGVTLARWRARERRRYVRVEIEPYRTDHATPDGLLAMFDAVHKRLLRRWWRRLLTGQPSISLEVHHSLQQRATDGDATAGEPHAPGVIRFAAAVPEGLAEMVEAALRGAYPNCRVRQADWAVGPPPVVLRLKKRFSFIKRLRVVDRFARREEQGMDRLLTVMGACREPAFVQLAMTPAPGLFERFARHCFKQHEARLARARRDHLVVRDRSMVDDAELRGGLDVQHRPLFFVDLRVVAAQRRVCERIASELRAQGAENSLVERGTTVRHGVLGLYDRRVMRGEGNPLPSFHKGVLASTELAALWQLPSVAYATMPLSRTPLPLAPAPPGILRPTDAPGSLHDSLGGVSIHVDLRRQNTAVPGTVEQGKSSYLVATVAEDLRRPGCAVIVLDPKGDAAEAAVSLVPADRTCTLLDLASPTCGFNPLAVDAPADVIADYVVAALKNLFTDESRILGPRTG